LYQAVIRPILSTIVRQKPGLHVFTFVSTRQKDRDSRLMWTQGGDDMTLTDTAIKALKPQAKRYLAVFRDGRPRAFAGGISNRRHRLNGKLEKVALGKYPALSLKAARQKRDELATLVARGQSPAKQKQLRKAALAAETTVREFGERYFADVVTRDRKDTKIMRRYLGKELYPALGDRPMREVTAADVQRIVFEKRDHGFPAAAADIRNLCNTRLCAACRTRIRPWRCRCGLSPRHDLAHGRYRRMKFGLICKTSTSPASVGSSSWRCI
jgi:hypothetical protein